MRSAGHGRIQQTISPGRGYRVDTSVSVYFLEHHPQHAPLTEIPSKVSKDVVIDVIVMDEYLEV